MKRAKSLKNHVIFCYIFFAICFLRIAKSVGPISFILGIRNFLSATFLKHYILAFLCIVLIELKSHFVSSFVFLI